MPNNQVKFNVAIISNVHIYQFFLLGGGGGRGVVGQIDCTFYSFFFFGGGGWE